MLFISILLLWFCDNAIIWKKQNRYRGKSFRLQDKLNSFMARIISLRFWLFCLDYATVPHFSSELKTTSERHDPRLDRGFRYQPFESLFSTLVYFTQEGIIVLELSTALPMSTHGTEKQLPTWFSTIRPPTSTTGPTWSCRDRPPIMAYFVKFSFEKKKPRRNSQNSTFFCHFRALRRKTEREALYKYWVESWWSTEVYDLRSMERTETEINERAPQFQQPGNQVHEETQ